MMTNPSRPFALRPAARVVGWIGFALFELLVIALVVSVASIRCCGASSPAGPQSVSEWIALALFALLMLLLGGTIGSGTALILEGLLRLVSRMRGSGHSGPSS